jgi:hypothetical protein
MDWYTIEYLYPLSFKRFTDMMFPNVGVISLSTLEYYDIKKLYQFFDKEGIYLNVEAYNKSQWVFSISLHNGISLVPNQTTRTTRDEIELDGFTECFKMLDKKIRCI